MCGLFWDDTLFDQKYLNYGVGILTAAAGVDGFGQSGRSDVKSIVLGDDHAVFVESLVSVLTSQGFRVPASPATRVLILAADRDAEAMRQAVRLGAAGYLHKTCGVRKLVHALERVIGGAVVLDTPRPSSPRSDVSEARRLAAHLTARERECLALLVEGLDTTAMTLRLGVSTTTVRSHVQALLTKLGVHSRLEAATFAVRYDLVDHDQHGRESRTRTG
jgi:DNA-binding CsgD family transcriptional regulator